LIINLISMVRYIMAQKKECGKMDKIVKKGRYVDKDGKVINWIELDTGERFALIRKRKQVRMVKIWRK